VAAAGKKEVQDLPRPIRNDEKEMIDQEHSRNE